MEDRKPITSSTAMQNLRRTHQTNTVHEDNVMRNIFYTTQHLTHLLYDKGSHRE